MSSIGKAGFWQCRRALLLVNLVAVCFVLTLLMLWEPSIDGAAGRHIVDNASGASPSAQVTSAPGTDEGKSPLHAPQGQRTLLDRFLEPRSLYLFALSVLAALLGGQVAVLSRKHKEASRLAEERYRYLADMSHELRTPLTGIMGLASLLEDARLSARERDYLTTIQYSGSELLAMINNILELTRVEPGGKQPPPCSVEIRPFTSSILQPFSAALRKKNIESAVLVSHDVPDRLVLERDKLRQILVNLIGNAIKFTDSGYVHVFVSTVHYPSNDLHLHVEVADSGPGISADEQKKLFDAFRQTEAGLRSHEAGCGLGLAISRRLASFAGGALGVDSTPGSGSRFWFELPCQVPPEGQERAASDQAESPAEPVPRRVVVLSHPTVPARALVDEMDRFGWDASLRSPAATPALGRIPESEVPDLLLVEASALRILDQTELEYLGELCRTNRAACLVLCNGYEDQQKTDSLRLAGLPTILRPLLYGEITRDYKQRMQPEGDLASLVVATHTHSGKRTLTSRQAPDHPARVLVGEDNPVNQLVLSRMLKRLGHVAKVLPEGEAVIQEFASSPGYDMILLDCNMPRMDGFETTRELRRRYSPKIPPIVAVTAHSPSAIEDRAMDAGISEVVAKPLSKDALVQLIARHCSSAGKVSVVPAGSQAEETSMQAMCGDSL